MTLGFGYLIGTLIFLCALVALATAADLAAKRFHPLPLLGDHRRLDDRGHDAGGFRRPLARHRLRRRIAAAARAACSASLGLWYRWRARSRSPQSARRGWRRSIGSRSRSRRRWARRSGTGSADAGLGYGGGALLFGALLVLVAVAYYRTRISHVLLFWVAFILTRPLGATVGDFFDKPLAQGGLNVSRPLASAIIADIHRDLHSGLAAARGRPHRRAGAARERSLTVSSGLIASVAERVGCRSRDRSSLARSGQTWLVVSHPSRQFDRCRPTSSRDQSVSILFASCMAERGDSNPRTPVKMLLEFQSSAFDRSATSPINNLR